MINFFFDNKSIEMALDKFKQNIGKDSLTKDLRKKWDNESLRVQKELLDDFSAFLELEDFSIQKNEYSVTAKYQEAVISISTSPNIPLLSDSGEDPTDRLKFKTTIKYNKWGDDTVLRVVVYVTNQKNLFGNEIDLETYSKHVKEFKPFKYLLEAEMGNDHSKIGFFGKVFAVSQYGLTDTKKFNQVEKLIEAVLNDEFTMKGVW